MTEEVTYEKLYELVDSRFNKLESILSERMDKKDREFNAFYKDEFLPIVEWKNNFMGRIAIISILALLIIHSAWDFIAGKMGWTK